MPRTPTPTSRRSSASSISSIAVAETPLLADHPHDPERGLVLVYDDDGPSPDDRDDFELSSDDEITDDISSRLDRLKASSIPPLTPPRVLLYLLLPHLLLGPFLLSTSHLPLRTSLPALFGSALASLAALRLSYMLTKYVRKADFDDLVLDVLARGHANERLRSVLRTAIRSLTTTFRVLLAGTYLQASTTVLLPLFPQVLAVPSHILLTAVLAALALPLTLSTSLDSRPIRYAACASIASYVVWLAAVTFAHAHGTLVPNPQQARLGALWKGVAPIAFAFTSSWSLPLYAALKASSPRHASPSSSSGPKPARRYAFQTLSLVSTGLAVALILPLCIYAAFPTAPLRSSSPEPSHGLDGNDIWKELKEPAPRPHAPHALIAAANALALLLAIPPLLVTAPPVPFPAALRRTGLPLSRIAMFVGAVVVGLIPGWVAGRISDGVLVGAIGGTYVVPALLHIIAHHFKSPLSIVLPGNSNSGMGTGVEGSADELLRRKERMLQRRRLGRRLAWDVIAWALVGLGVAGVVLFVVGV